MLPSSRAGVFYLFFPQLSALDLKSYSTNLVLSSYRFAGRPGDYVYVFGGYRMEEVGITLHAAVLGFLETNIGTFSQNRNSVL